MCAIKKTAKNREAFTLVEMLVVVAIVLALAALAAAFMPRVSDNQNLSRAVDSVEQWLLTAKMRAKRDGVATGIRFVQAQGDTAGTFSQVQYIQQPPPLAGGWLSTTPTTGSVAAPSPPFPAGNFLTGGAILSASKGTVVFSNVDFTLGGIPLQSQWLVQSGDYLSIYGGSVYLIGNVTGPNTLQLATPYGALLSLGSTATPPAPPTTNYTIYRQPRIFIGEEPLTLPNNYVVDMRIIPGTTPSTMPTILTNAVIPNNSTIAWSNVAPRVAAGVSYYEILFSPSGAVIGSNAGNSIVLLTVMDTTMESFDTNRLGIVAVQSRTGFIGAYNAAPGVGLPGYYPFTYAQSGRESGL